MAQFSFDARSYEPSASPTRSPLPRAEYPAIVIDSALKTTKAGDGQYIELTIQVIDGEYSGRRIWDRLNVNNPNKGAEDTAKGALKSLCAACRVDELVDTAQLHDLPFTLSLDLDRKDPSRNRVMAYLPALTGAAPLALAAARATSPAPAKKPWEK